jgi:hypothetical protein
MALTHSQLKLMHECPDLKPAWQPDIRAHQATGFPLDRIEYSVFVNPFSFYFSEEAETVISSARRQTGFNPFKTADTVERFGPPSFQPDVLDPFGVKLTRNNRIYRYVFFVGGGYPLFAGSLNSYLVRNIHSRTVSALHPTTRLLVEIPPIDMRTIQLLEGEFNKQWRRFKKETKAYLTLVGPADYDWATYVNGATSALTMCPEHVRRSLCGYTQYYKNKEDEDSWYLSGTLDHFFSSHRLYGFYFWLQRRVYGWDVPSENHL